MRTPTTVLSGVMLLALGSLLAGVGGSCRTGSGTRTRERSAAALLISEIAPEGGRLGQAWIELHNRSGAAVVLAGAALATSDTERFVLPDDVPELPPDAYVLIRLDGNTTTAGTHEKTEGTLVIHGLPSLASPWTARRGELALYEPPRTAKEPSAMADFVAWGARPSDRLLRDPRRHLWPPRAFVGLTDGFGFYDERTTLPAGWAIGLLPGSRGGTPVGWAVYAAAETSPGAENVLPSPKAFTPADGAVVGGSHLSIAWAEHRGEDGYDVQLARDRLFTHSSLVMDATVVEPTVLLPVGLPAGRYYYHVRSRMAEGRSMWSRVRTVEVELVLCGDPATRPKQIVRVAGVEHRLQRKDTDMLCLEGCDEDHWDRPHPFTDNTPAAATCGPTPASPTHGDHGAKYCVPASVSMVASAYGACLSQDAIAQHVFSGAGPDYDLGHGYLLGEEVVTQALEWALGVAAWGGTGSGTDLWSDTSGDPMPSFSTVVGWVGAGRPVLSGGNSHAVVIDGACIDQGEKQWIHVLDPKQPSPLWQEYGTWTAEVMWTAPAQGALAGGYPVEDDAGIGQDSDGDGVSDFDELYRFKTDPAKVDTDGDGVPDRADIREYVFDFQGNYSRRTADFDGDGVRKELDPDNDCDGLLDGQEDANHDGRQQPGESSNFFLDPGHRVALFPCSCSCRSR